MRLLMCPPEHFDVTYEINPWMRVANGPDAAKAQAQWAALYDILTTEVGAEVLLMTARSRGLPDMVFTANAGITKGNYFLPSRFSARRAAGGSGVLYSMDAGPRL